MHCYIFIHADDDGRRGYCHHFVMMYVCRYVCGYVSTIKRKPLIGITWNSAQLWSSTVCSFGFKGTGGIVIGLYQAVRKFDNMCSSLYSTPTLDRQTDRQTDRNAITISRYACIACWRTIKAGSVIRNSLCCLDELRNAMLLAILVMCVCACAVIFKASSLHSCSG